MYIFQNLYNNWNCLVFVKCMLNAVSFEQEKGMVLEDSVGVNN